MMLPLQMDNFWMNDSQVRSLNPLSRLAQNCYAIEDCCSTPGWEIIQGAQHGAAKCATKYVTSELA